MISGLILAAGESRRMGELKPLLRINGLTFLQHIEQALRGAGIEEIIAVIGHQAARIQNESGANVRFVVNPNYQLGQLSSLQTGIRAVGNAEAVIVCLVDQPHVQPAWIEQLVTAFREAHPLIVRPCCKGRCGHPVLYAAELYTELLNLPLTETAKAVFRRHGERTRLVEIDSEGILLDADTPEDYAAIRRFFDASE
ncbi:MAG: nucleotidyltransferase family protein [candidate division KSB1 bacterium]|nr:nucleotidyltransferase family protein [candidate division KSB1 bacterium]